MTQPRRGTKMSLARYVAEEMENVSGFTQKIFNKVAAGHAISGILKSKPCK